MWVAFIRWMFENRLNTRPTIASFDKTTRFDAVRYQFESKCG